MIENSFILKIICALVSGFSSAQNNENYYYIIEAGKLPVLHYDLIDFRMLERHSFAYRC
jgi:hypothetical protein